MPEIILIRGIPGTGKTTLAKTKYPNHVLCEADQYFTDEHGNFNYDPLKVKRAHFWCIQKATDAVFADSDIVVANQFIRNYEITPYFELVKFHDCELKIIECLKEYGSIREILDEYMQHARECWEELVEPYVAYLIPNIP